jgi:hypothetical protein
MKAATSLCFLGFVLLTSSSAMAATGELYASIRVPEKDATPTIQGIPVDGVNALSKTVGGLKCVQTTGVTLHPVTKYTCNLNSQDLNAEAIYNALAIEEKDARPRRAGTPSVGADITSKSAENLTCTKTIFVIREATATYTCAVTF